MIIAADFVVLLRKQGKTDSVRENEVITGTSRGMHAVYVQDSYDGVCVCSDVPFIVAPSLRETRGMFSDVRESE